jgi:hypothetical protein
MKMRCEIVDIYCKFCNVMGLMYVLLYSTITHALCQYCHFFLDRCFHCFVVTIDLLYMLHQLTTE